jgi:hypothetical protein
MNQELKVYTNQEITSELRKRLNHNTLPDDDRLRLIRMLLKINQDV